MDIKNLIKLKKDRHAFNAAYINMVAEEILSQTADFHNAQLTGKTNIYSSGEHNQKRRGMGNEFWQYQEYQQGTPINKIDWRKSAASDSLYTRELEWQKPQDILIDLQPTESMCLAYNSSDLSKYQYASILCYVLATKFIHAHERVSLLGTAYKNTQSKNTLPNLSQILAEQSFNEKEASKTSNKAYTVIADDFWHDKSEIDNRFRLMNVSYGGGLVLHIVAKEELDFPFKGRFDVSSTDDEFPLTAIAKIEDTKKAYQQRVEEHMRFVGDAAQKYQLTYLRVRNDEAFADVVNNIHRLLYDAKGGF